ncbi:MAG: MarR family winged helix-turn-helix transcriptional regulator [Alphaproteobacteria bacterium]|nr:MarR family winged helix-turn-helix transcriptional regulator [Alphaproteobacteria bacterium]
MPMTVQEKLDTVFASDLSHLMAVSYIVLCNNAVTDRYIEREFGIPVHAWSSLFAVETFPGIKAKEIRKIFPRPQNTISRAIALLEARGLVRQEASQEDGREKKIFITPEGQAVLKDIRQVSVDRQSEIFEPLSAKELKTFTQLALKIANGPALKDSKIMRRGD